MSIRTTLPLLFVFLFSTAVLSGCAGPSRLGQEQALDKLAGSFEATVGIRYGGLTAEAAIVRDSPQSCAVTFTSPDSLRDMAFIFREDSVDVTYKGLKFAFEPSAMPGRAVAKTVVSSLNALTNKSLHLASANGVLEAEGQTESGIFILQVNPDSGVPLKLSVPDEELEIEFLNFMFLE